MIKANKLTRKRIIGTLIATTMILNNLGIFTFAQYTNTYAESSINNIVQDSNDTIEIISEGNTETSSETTTETSSETTTETSSETTTETSSETTTETSSETTTETSSETTTETSSETTTETSSETTTEVGSETTTDVDSEITTEVGSEGSTEVSSEGSTEETSKNDGGLEFEKDYFYEDLTVEAGETNFNLINGIEYDKEKYIIAVEDQGGFDINTVGTYTVAYVLISYSTKEVVANFTRTVTVVERTSNKVKFNLPPLKIEKGAKDYDLLEDATAYTYNDEELKLYIKDLRDFDVEKMGIYTVLFGVESDLEEYANEEAERKIIVFGTDEDVALAENKYNVKTVTGEIISYDTLEDALKYEIDLEENLEILLSGEYTFTKDNILALSSNERNLIIRGKGIATIKAEDNLSFISEYAKLENLNIEFSKNLPEINASSTVLELIDISFGENLPIVNSTNILTIKNGAYEEIKNEKGIVYLIGENITINSKVYGFKTLNIGGNEEKLIL
ncbi:MAG: hypothetical protein K2L15_03750, partial [Eubacteriales bacterium]|nr:hypothetical protein [Eubacteriales bacterium]